MRILWSALGHMLKWGAGGGMVMGALYGLVIAITLTFGPALGLLFGGIIGGGVGLLLGIPCGYLLARISRHYDYPEANALAYSRAALLSTAICAFAGAWPLFSELLAEAGTLAFPGIPALIASLTMTFASKRYSKRFYYIYRKRAAPE